MSTLNNDKEKDDRRLVTEPVNVKNKKSHKFNSPFKAQGSILNMED